MFGRPLPHSLLFVPLISKMHDVSRLRLLPHPPVSHQVGGVTLT